MRGDVGPFDVALAELEGLLVDLNGDGRPDARVVPQGGQGGGPGFELIQPPTAPPPALGNHIAGGNAMMRMAAGGPVMTDAGPQTSQEQPPNRNFMQMVAQNPRGWGAAPPGLDGPQGNAIATAADMLIPRQSNNAMATYRAQMLPYAEYDDGTAGFSYPQIVPDTWNAMLKLGRAAESAFGAKYAPQDVMPTAQDAALLSGVAMTGGIAVPRPAGSIGAFGRLKTAEDLATRGKYQNPRKPLDWGGASKLAQARTAERKGMSPDDVWEAHGWARQGEPGSSTFNREAAERYGIKPGDWYTEYGSSPAMLGERYDLGIGQRKRVPPWRSDAPETAFEAEAVYEAPRFSADEPAPRPRPAAPYEGGNAVRAPANQLTANIRKFEDELRASGKTGAEIATALERRFLQRVTPQDLAAGNVWWRMTEQIGRETGRGERGRFLPARDRLTPEARAALQSDEFAGLTNMEAVKALKDRFDLDFSREAVVDLRHELGTPASARVALPPEAEKALKSPEMQGLTNRQASDMLREQYGVELSPNAVRHRRERRGVKPEQHYGFAPMQLPPEAEKALRSARYQKLGKRMAARALKEDFGIDVSHETLRQIRLRLGL